MDPLKVISLIHLLNALLLLNGYLGLFFYLLFQRQIGAGAKRAANWMLAPLWLVQPLTGAAMVAMTGFAPAETWLLATYGFYALLLAGASLGRHALGALLRETAANVVPEGPGETGPEEDGPEETRPEETRPEENGQEENGPKEERQESPKAMAARRHALLGFALAGLSVALLFWAMMAKPGL